MELSKHVPAHVPVAERPVAPPSPAQEDPEWRNRLRRALGDRYDTQDLVAVGGMASLFLLQHRVHGGLFVAKVLQQELATRPEVVARFRKEALHAARLGGHPNGIPVVDAGEAEGLHFLTMPFVEGEDLDRVLKSHGPMARSEALHFAAQIASYLAHAESRGITHADLAPGNIRLDIFGRYRVMDLGLSHSVDDPEYQHLGGTPLYCSPEQLRGETPDVRSDLYALGTILYEVLTGESPFQADTLEAIHARHLKGDWQLPESIAGDVFVTKLLHSLINPDRNERMSSAFELGGALAAAGFERPEFRPRPVRPGSGTRRHRLS